jgi:hypothetical protein
LDTLVNGGANREAKLDIIHPYFGTFLLFLLPVQFASKKIQQEMAWLEKAVTEVIAESTKRIEGLETEEQSEMVARLAAELPKKGEDANWSDELRVAVWKRRQRDEVRANLAQTSRIEELEQQILGLTDQLEEARFNTAVAEADANGDAAVVVAEDPAARAEALTGVVQALAGIAQVRVVEDGGTSVAPEAPASDDTAAVIDLVAGSTEPAPEVIEIVAPETPVQEVASAELPGASEVVEPAPVEESAAA